MHTLGNITVTLNWFISGGPLLYIRQISKTNVQAQEQYRLYCSHSHNTALYGFQLLYFSSINMDGAAEEWSTEGGPMRRQTHSQLDKAGIQPHM